MAIDIQGLKMLVEELAAQVDGLLAISDSPELRREYLKWYSQAQLVVNKSLSSMAREFGKLYYAAEETDGEGDAWHYWGIRSYLRTTQDYSDKVRLFEKRFRADVEQQRGILLAIPHAIDIRALEIAALVTADLVEGELNEAHLLLSHGFVRAAGAVAGVALEAHLKLLHNQSNLTYSDKDTIVPLATRLRQAGAITLGDEKKCIAMSDTRNKCDHKNKQDPTSEEVDELIDDVDRFVKRVQVI
jgi:hypothetical protein